MNATPTRTFGKIEIVKIKEDIPSGFVEDTDDQTKRSWQYGQKKGTYFRMSSVAPHVCIVLKNFFATLRKWEMDFFMFPAKEDSCHDLVWFMDRYPMEMDSKTRSKLKSGKKKFLSYVRKMDSILTEGYHVGSVALKEGFQAREYQIKGAEVFLLQKKMILADFLGLGKSLTATMPMVMEPTKALPALVVCQTHMTHQWKHEAIEKFTNLKAYIIPTGPVYKLPPSDVYIITYSRLSKWNTVLMHMVKYIIFDEVQSLRCAGSLKYNAAQNLCDYVDYTQGLSHTPIYNYGIEMWIILDCIKRGCVGDFDDWQRQWGWKEVNNPAELGSFLREKYLMLRRSDKDVGRELPQINVIMKSVEYDDSEVEKLDTDIQDLALSFYSSTNFMEKGQMGRMFDLRARQETGVAKATSVAALVKMLCESGKQVLLSGWHRAVYEIWLDILKEFNPVLYTGSESDTKKRDSKQAFIDGTARVLIISNLSGAGLDGLQYVCHDVVIGELDWSPKVHDQIIGRVNRDGQENPVTVYYPVCDDGSDPAMIEILGIKSFQSQGIMDPFTEVPAQFTDESRVKKLAESYLIRKNQKGLKKLMQSLIEKEEYEKADEVKKLIDKAKDHEQG